MTTSPLTISNAIAQAWSDNDDDDLYTATEQLLDAGLYNEPCLANIANRFPALEGSALRMDALNIAGYLDIVPESSPLHIRRCMLFAIPVIGQRAAIEGFAMDTVQHARLARAINVAGLVEASSHVHILAGAWDAPGLVRLHPQMVRNTIREALFALSGGGALGHSVLPALADLPTISDQRTGNIGAVVFALVLDTEEEYEEGVPDPLRFLLAEEAPEAIHSPQRDAVDDPCGTWTKVWKDSGPGAMISCLMPVFAGGAAAATVEIDCLSGLLDNGGVAKEPFDTTIQPTDQGGAVIELVQNQLHYRAVIPPRIFTAIGASLIDRFNPTGEDEDALTSLPAALPTPPHAPHPSMSGAATAAFFGNLCPPQGRLH